MAAILLLTSGLIILSSGLKGYLTKVSSPVGNFANRLSMELEQKGLIGHFGIGSLLGAAWGPCVGPTLGLVLGLATKQESRAEAVLLMVIFGLGLNAPFVAMAYGFRKYLISQKARFMSINRWASPVLGAALVVKGATLLFGIEKVFESYLVSILPSRLLALLTSI